MEPPPEPKPPAEDPPPKRERNETPGRPIISPPHEFITRGILVKRCVTQPAPFRNFLLDYARVGFLAGIRNALTGLLEATAASRGLTLSMYNRVAEFSTAMVARVYTALWTRSRFITQKVLAFTPGAGWPPTATHKMPQNTIVPSFVEHLQEALGSLLMPEFDCELVVALHHGNSPAPGMDHCRLGRDREYRLIADALGFPVTTYSPLETTSATSMALATEINPGAAWGYGPAATREVRGFDSQPMSFYDILLSSNWVPRGITTLTANQLALFATPGVAPGGAVHADYNAAINYGKGIPRTVYLDEANYNEVVSLLYLRTL